MTLNEFYTTVGGNYEDVIARLPVKPSQRNSYG